MIGKKRKEKRKRKKRKEKKERKNTTLATEHPNMSIKRLKLKGIPPVF